MTLIEAAKLALEALKYSTPIAQNKLAQENAITALRTAIEAAKKQEPVAWAVVGDGEHGEYEVGRMLEKKSKANFQYWEARGYELIPLYATPPAAQRQPLTDEQIDDIWNRYCDEMGEASINDAYDIARAIEAAHGIK